MDSLPPHRLGALAEQARRDLAMLDYPAREWVRPLKRAEGRVHDVVIVGAGQHGIAAAFALRRQAVRDVLLIDAAPAGGAGVWRRFARMRTLRTPKHVTGPELGFASLSARAWYEARHGEAA